MTRKDHVFGSVRLKLKPLQKEKIGEDLTGMSPKFSPFPLSAYFAPHSQEEQCC